MTILTLPDPPVTEVDLEPEMVLGGAPAIDGPLGGNRASLGGPIIQELTARQFGDDPELAEYVSRSEFSFYHLTMTFSLAAASGWHVDEAVVAFLLESDSGMPIAWSMSPLRLEGTPVTTRKSGSGSIEVPIVQFLKIGGEWAEEKSVAQCYIRALGELENDPEWRLQRTPTVDLSRQHDLSMIVRVERHAPVDGSIRVSARVGGPRGLFRARVPRAEWAGSFRCEPGASVAGVT